MSVGRILFGYYRVPDSASEPIDFTVNLEGEELRSAKRCVVLKRLPTVIPAFITRIYSMDPRRMTMHVTWNHCHEDTRHPDMMMLDSDRVPIRPMSLRWLQQVY